MPKKSSKGSHERKAEKEAELSAFNEKVRNFLSCTVSNNIVQPVQYSSKQRLATRLKLYKGCNKSPDS
jgi:hypothetical protein